MLGIYIVVQYYRSCHILLVSGCRSQGVADEVAQSPVEQVMNTQRSVKVYLKDCKLNSRK